MKPGPPVNVVAAMEIPDLKPVEPDKPQSKRLFLICVAVFILAAFAYALLINIPEWR